MILVRTLTIVALGTLAACGQDGEGESRPPSVLLISLDTLRSDHMSLYGYERNTTPYLEELAQECSLYDNAYTVSCWTLPAHMTMLTGLHPAQHGVTESDLALGPDFPLLSERLKEAGNQALGFHFPGWTGPRHGFARGYDLYRSHGNAEEAEKHMREALAKRNERLPLFLFLHIFDIHSQPISGTFYEAPPPYDRLFSPDAIDRLAGHPWPDILDQELEVSEAVLADLRAVYDGGIAYVDYKLREWIEGWRESGLLDESILIITADHGESLGTRRSRIRGHGKVFQEGLHVPLLVRLPGGREGGRRLDDPVGNVDIVPTVLDFVGLGEDPRLPGYSLLTGRPQGSVVFADHKGTQAYIRWPWKVLLSEGGNWDRAYNLVEDPDELRSYHRVHPDTRLRFAAIRDEVLAAFEAEYGTRGRDTYDPIPFGVPTAAELAALDDLGYAGY